MATKREVSAAIGYSVRRLDQLVAEGAIRKPDDGQWEALTVAKEIIAFQAAAIDRMRAETASKSAALQRATNSDGSAKAAEELRKIRLQSDKAELELAAKRGELVPINQVADVWQSAVLVLKTRLNAIPARLAPRVHAAPTIAAAESEIRGEVDQALEDLGNVRVEAKGGNGAGTAGAGASAATAA